MTDTEITSLEQPPGSADPAPAHAPRARTQRAVHRRGGGSGRGRCRGRAGAARFGLRAAGSALGGPGFIDASEHALAAASTLGSSTRVIGVYEQVWGSRTGDARLPPRRPRSRATSERSCVPPRRSASATDRSAPAARTRTARSACAHRWARCSRLTLRRGGPTGRTVALDAHRGVPLSELARRARSDACSSAPSVTGCPTT